MTESHPSPFLPGTQIQFAWDSTSLGWLKTCPRLYQYCMIEGWRHRGQSVHLDFGGFYHSALELFDRKRAEGQSYDDALFEAVKYCLEVTWVFDDPTTGIQGGPMDWGHNLKTRETLVRTVIWYLEQFKDDPITTLILANGKPAVELSFKLELDFSPDAVEFQPYVISGHLDRVVDFSGDFFVMDRKTSSTTISPYYFDQYAPDNQMSLYTFASQVIYKTPVKGVIIDAAQIAVGFSRFERGFTHRTPSQIEEWLTDTKHWLRLAEAYATEGFWPMNDKSCHHYGGCAFRKVCSKAPEVRQKFLETDFVKRQWNPLEPR